MADETEELTENKEQDEAETESQQGAEGAGQADEVKDSHGQQGINKERHDREVNELNDQISALKEQIAEMSKSEEGRKEMAAKVEELEKKMADEAIAHKLEMAGCLDVKMAKAVFADFDNDVAKLKEARPWLFGSKVSGKTGGKPAGASVEDFDKKLDRAFGIKEKN